MRRKGAHMRAILWFSIGIALWVVSSGALLAWKRYTPESQVSVRSQSTAFSEAELRAIEKALGRGRVAGVAQQLRQQVSANETMHSVSIDVIWFSGDASLAMVVKLLAGNMPIQGDEIGCAISAKTARQLFGSTDIVGKTVMLSGAALTVRGVFEGQYAAATFLADPGRDMMLAPFSASTNAVQMTAFVALPILSNTQIATEAVQEAMQQAGVFAQETMTDFSDVRSLLTWLADLPALFCAVLTLTSAVSCGFAAFRRFAAQTALLREDRLASRFRYIRLLAGFCGILSGVIAIATLAVVLAPDYKAIPPRYLPTAWSDFSFWSKLFATVRTNIANNALAIALRTDMIRNMLAGWSAMLPLLSIVCLWRGNALIRKAENTKMLHAAIIAVLPMILAVFAGLWLTKAFGWLPNASLYMSVLPAFPLLTRSFAERYHHHPIVTH